MSTFSQQVQWLLNSSLPEIEKLWQMAGFSPNDQQREAILHTDGPLFLTAGPGSGKTRVLLWRTLNLIVYHNVQPSEIFLSTFTEKAALQLTDGLRALLGLVTNITGQPYDLSQMYIGTVHSLCQRMLSDRRRFFEDRHRPRRVSLLDELGQYFFLYESGTWERMAQSVNLDSQTLAAKVNQIFERNSSNSKHRAIENLRPLFNRFSEEMLDVAVSRTKLNTLPLSEDINTEEIHFLLNLYDAYLRELSGAKKTDFALLQREAFEVLQRFSNAGKVFKHVIVDEYQDTNYVQERIFFKLAEGTGNICVVGDDDQALYRFRGATVENFVQFSSRCRQYLNRQPRRIDLDKNYRSKKHIVDFYTRFMNQTDWWDRNNNQSFRVEKNIEAYRLDVTPAVLASTPGAPEDVCKEIARFVRRLIDEGKVENPNQIAFLYPSLRSEQVTRMKRALEDQGLQVYAPRATRFLEVEEARDVFGIFVDILGAPRMGFYGQEVQAFSHWLEEIENRACQLEREDPRLNQFVKDRRAEIHRIIGDYQALLKVVERNHWSLSQPYDINKMKRALVEAPGLSEVARRIISSVYADRAVLRRAQEGRTTSLRYMIYRATSLDWNVLDLFYVLMGFQHFKKMFDRAEQNGDEGSVANLGMITQYLQRSLDEHGGIITGNLLEGNKFSSIFFGSYIFALFRLGESELEDREDPFPRGRIPFLTIHQAKGLEFPVVVLGNPARRDHGVSKVECIARLLSTRSASEPLEKIYEFDTMRMFYVGLSRPKELLILAHFHGKGQQIYPAFRSMLNEAGIHRLPAFDLNTLSSSPKQEDSLPKVYSFTGDYLLYQKCPRQYMIFRKFGFVPSRSETMFFGSLVHRTLEDLHHELIRRRRVQLEGEKRD